MKHLVSRAHALLTRQSNAELVYTLAVLLALGLAAGVQLFFGAATARVVTALGMAVAAVLVVEGLRRHAASRREDQALSASLRLDSLTGALSRRFFVEELNEAVRRARMTRGGAGVTLLLIDLDHFKKLNDSHGHKAGDHALAHFVARTKEIFKDGTVGRLGGDEFAVLVRGATPDDCAERAQALLHLLGRPVLAGGQQFHLSASIGVAAAPDHALFSEDLNVLADLALYESKRMGRGRVTLFDDQFLKEERHRRFIERELRASILLDHLDVHYQPILDDERRCAGTIPASGRCRRATSSRWRSAPH